MTVGDATIEAAHIRLLTGAIALPNEGAPEARIGTRLVLVTPETDEIVAGQREAKAGVIGLTKSLGKELADKNIAVNCITPAAAKTRIFDQMTEEHINYMLSKIPRNRFAKVEELASLVAWLASEENSFSTGAVFDLSGGRATY